MFYQRLKLNKKIVVITIFVMFFGLVSPNSSANALSGWTNGKFNKGYNFNNDAQVNCGSVYNSVKTVSFWMKADTTTEKIMQLRGDAYVEVSVGTITTTGFTSPTIYVDGIAGTTVDTNWHYIVITVGTGIDASAVSLGGIGANYFNGVLDDVKMYSHALSSREIAEHYRQRSPSLAQGGIISDLSAYAALTITQSGAGKIVDFVGDLITTGAGLALSVDGLTTGTGLDITSTSAEGGASGSSKMLNLARSGTNANVSHTAYGLYSAVTNTGTTSTNIGGYFSASGATNNYGLIVESGNIGIGTNGPDRLLHAEVSDAVTNTVTYAQRLSHITSGTAATNFGTGIEFELEGADGTNNILSAIQAIQTDATTAAEEGELAFLTADIGDDGLAERMRIDKDGNIGIGTDSPNQELEVVGTVDADGLIISGSTEMISVSTGMADNDKLVTKGYVDDNAGGGDFSDGGEVGGADRTLGNTDNYDLGFLTNNINRLHIQNDGNVGIGTTSPSYLLHVAGDIGINAGSDLYINSIGLNDVGTSNITSGASLIGAYDEFDSSDSTNVQDILDDFDANIGSVSYRAKYDRVVAADGTGTDTTIAGAISNAAAGDTIFITAGTYNENITIDKSLELIGSGRNATTIAGVTGSPTIAVNSAISDVTVSTMKITNAGSATTDNVISVPSGTQRYRHYYKNLEISGGYRGIYMDDLDESEISNSYIHDTGYNGIKYYTCYDILVSNNIIKNTGATAIYDDASERTKISGNYIYNSEGAGINLLGADNAIASNNIINDTGASGIYNYRSDYLTITGNTIKNAGDNAIFTYGDTVTVSNNTIEDAFDNGIRIYNSTGVAITGNAIYSSGGDGIDIDSTFVNYITVTSNTLNLNTGYGIKMNGSVNDAAKSVIANNTFRNNTSGSIDTPDLDQNILVGPNITQGDIDVMSLLYYPATGSTFSNDLIELVLDGEDADSFTGNALRFIVDQSQNTGNLILAEDDASNMLFRLNETGGLYAAGDVGIGVNTPTAKLTVTQSGAGDIVNIFDGATEVFTILDGGNVGIGTTSPDQIFEILEATSSTPQLRLTQQDNTNYADFEIDSAGDLTITMSGNDLLVDDNLWVSDGNPAIASVSGSGNLIVENKIYLNGDNENMPRHSCPTGWVLVPGNSDFGTEDFCVMKYEAKKDATTKNPTSVATGTPWVNVSWYEAKNACKRVGAHLMTDAEWMTMARNIEALAINDLDTVAGLQLATGHSDSADAGGASNALASIDDADPVVSGCALTSDMENASNAYVVDSCEIRGDGSHGADPGDANDKGFYDTGQDWADGTYVSGGANKAQLRTHILSNSEVLWDIAGNVFEWTDARCANDADAAWDDNADYIEWDSTTPDPDLSDYERIVGGSTTNTSANGVGTYRGCTMDGNAFMRSGRWVSGSNAGVLTMFLGDIPGNVHPSVGFRCAR